MMISAPCVIVHRDRDFLSDNEVSVWGKPFADAGIAVFCPKLCDTEAYCSTAEHVSSAADLPLEEVASLRQDVIVENIDELRLNFRQKRQFANSKLWKDGGAPTTNMLWPDDQPPSEEQIYGKLLLIKIQEELKKRKLVERSFDLTAHPCQALANELRIVLLGECETLSLVRG